MLHASKTWPLTKPNLQRLQRNDRAMIRHIYNVRPQDIVTTSFKELHARLGIEDLDLILKERRLRWYGHVECSNGAVKIAFDIQVDGKHQVIRLLKGTDTFSGEANLPKTFLPPFWKKLTLKGKNLLPWKRINSKKKEFAPLGSKFFPFRVDTFSQA